MSCCYGCVAPRGCASSHKATTAGSRGLPLAVGLSCHTQEKFIPHANELNSSISRPKKPNMGIYTVPTLVSFGRDRAAIRLPRPRPQVPLQREKATRQQGGFFSRENSSNGGKAIRTFLAS